MRLSLSLLPWLAYPSEKHALTNHIPVIRSQDFLGFGVWDLELAAFGGVHGRK
jgi:hypothetical protein